MKKLVLAALALSSIFASAPASAQQIVRMCNRNGCQIFVIPTPQRIARPMAPMQGYYRNNAQGGGLFGGQDNTQHLRPCGSGPSYQQGGPMFCATR